MIKFNLPPLKYSDRYRILVLFLALNVPLILLLLLRNMQRVDLSLLTGIYLFCVALGYYSLALLLIITLIFLAGFKWPKIATAGTAVVLVIFIFYLLIDGQTYSLTSIHLNLFWLKWIIKDYEDLGLPKTTIPYALLALLLVVAVEWGLFKIVRRFPKPKYLSRAFWILSLFSLAASQIIHVVTYEKNDIRITSLTPHLPAYTPLTSHSNASRLSGLLSLDEATIEAEAGEFKGPFHYPLNEITLAKPQIQQTPNILIIFIESWRFDMMNEKITPHIFELSQKSTVASQHFCTGNSTVAGTFGFFYGIHPTYWPAVKANNAAIDNPVMIDALQKLDYTFGVFAKSNFERHKLKDAIFRGIDIREDFAGTSVIDQDRDMTEQFKIFLRNQKNSSKPFFGFIFFKSNHAPYIYPPEDSIFLPANDQNLMLATGATDPANYLNDYKNATHYVDRLSGEVLDEIESLGFLSNTIIIVTTEHGEEFNDNQNNFWGHGSNFTNFQTIVPLIIFAPGKAPKLLDYPSSHVDIVPTILQEFLDCANDVGEYSNGRNLYKENPEPRPFVIGSYVNHAYAIDDNVYEILPLYTKNYKLNNIRAEASPPSPEMLKKLMEEMSRFYNSREEVVKAGP